MTTSKEDIEQYVDKNCTWCVEPITKFKDELSATEYQISGLCQKCQDEVFDEPEDSIVMQPRSSFRDRETVISTWPDNGQEPEVLNRIPIPDELILCDFCNAEIDNDPVPVLNNSYALCEGCYARQTNGSNINSTP